VLFGEPCAPLETRAPMHILLLAEAGACLGRGPRLPLSRPAPSQSLYASTSATDACSLSEQLDQLEGTQKKCVPMATPFPSHARVEKGSTAKNLLKRGAAAALAYETKWVVVYFAAKPVSIETDVPQHNLCCHVLLMSAFGITYCALLSEECPRMFWMHIECALVCESGCIV